jgi:Fe-S-cluster containining protein
MRLPEGDSELVQIVDASLAEAARRSGEWLACRPGCTQCCYGAFAITQLDAFRLKTGMRVLHAADPSVAEAVKERARAWLAEYLPTFPGDRETGILGESDADLEKFEDFANDAPCPALNTVTGLCEVYAWRPMTCRVFGPPIRTEAGDESATALAHCELCFKGATESQVAACEMPIPHGLEAKLLDEIPSRGQTTVAFALLG